MEGFSFVILRNMDISVGVVSCCVLPSFQTKPETESVLVGLRVSRTHDPTSGLKQLFSRVAG